MARSVYQRFGTSALAGSDQTARRHVYIAGETMPAIAAVELTGGEYNSEIWRQLAEFNSIEDLDDISAGTVLTLPQPTPTE